MSVAYIFDAVLQNRCYRKAIMLDRSFSIIEKRKALIFNTLIDEYFLIARPKAEIVHKTFIGL